MKKSFVFAAFFASLICFCFCACESQLSSAQEPVNKADTQAIVINSVYELSEDDPNAVAGAGRYVTVSFSPKADSSIVKNSRTLLPQDVELYFSVAGSTKIYAADSTVSSLTDSSYSDVSVEGDSDQSQEAANTQDTVVIEPYYATETNVMSGITLILKVGETYAFTTYGTQQKPADISTSLFGEDVTGDTIYTSRTGDTDLTGKITTASSALSVDSNKNIHYACRELLTKELSSLAVVSGTAYYKIVESAGSIKIYKAEADVATGTITAGSTEASSIKINTTSSSKGTGNVLVPVNLEKTVDLGTSVGTNYVVDKVEFRLVGTSEYSVDINSISGADLNTAFYLTGVPSGKYSTFLIFYAKDASGSYDDIYTIPDTLTVWKGQTSTLYGNSSYYTSGLTSFNSSYTEVYSAGTSASNTGADADATTVTLANVINSSSTASVKAYNITESMIKNAYRTVFYVTNATSTTGTNSLSHSSTTELGSIHYPFDTLSDAIKAIQEAREKGYALGTTEWHIVIDGKSIDDADSISYANSYAQDLNLVIHPFSSNTVDFANNVTFTNAASSNEMNVWLTNINWTPASSASTFTAGANIYLQSSKINGSSWSYAEPSYVDIYKNYTDSSSTTFQDGVFYTSGTDSSTIFGIRVQSADLADIYNTLIVDYAYTDPKGKANGTNYIDNNPYIQDVSKYDSTADAPTYGISALSGARFALDAVWEYSKKDSSAGTEPFLTAETEVGDKNYGDLVLWTKVTNIAVLFKESTLKAQLYSYTTGSSSATTETSTAQTLALTTSETTGWASGDTNTITATFKVTSSDGTNYPVSDAADVFTKAFILPSSSTDTALTAGITADNGTSSSDEYITASLSAPSAVDSSFTVSDSAKEAYYTVTITLPETFAASAYETYSSDTSAVDNYTVNFVINGVSDTVFSNSINFTVGYSEN